MQIRTTSTTTTPLPNGAACIQLAQLRHPPTIGVHRSNGHHLSTHRPPRFHLSRLLPSASSHPGLKRRSWLRSPRRATGRAKRARPWRGTAASVGTRRCSGHDGHGGDGGVGRVVWAKRRRCVVVGVHGGRGGDGWRDGYTFRLFERR